MKDGQVPSRQEGIAALTAILVVAIATVLAVNLLWTTSVDIQRTQTLLLQDQARLYDLGGEELAKYFLADDAREDGQGGIDSTQETWAKLLVREFKDGTLEGWLVDQQGLFDLNSLVDPGTTKRNDAAVDQFVRLLRLLDLESPLDEGTATGLAEAVVDWIDPDTQMESSGAEDDYYTGLQPPYYPANFWFTSVSELQAVKGFTPEILALLTPHVTALPPRGEGGGRWPLNVNTTTDLVMASLIPNQTTEGMKAVTEFEAQPQRGPGVEVVTQEFESDTDFREAFRLVTGAEIPAEIPLGISSNWFLLTVTTSIGTTRSTMYSLLERTDQAVRTRLRAFDAN